MNESGIYIDEKIRARMEKRYDDFVSKNTYKQLFDIGNLEIDLFSALKRFREKGDNEYEVSMLAQQYSDFNL